MRQSMRCSIKPQSRNSLKSPGLASQQTAPLIPSAQQLEMEEREALLSKCTKILQIHPSRRPIEEQQMLLQFAQTITFFRNLMEQNSAPDILKKCVNVLKYQMIEENETLFRVGDHGSLFYIILSGSVGINIKLPTFDNPDQFELKEVNVLKAGASFGELALLNDNAKRTATIIAKTDCQFAIMEKNNYRNILGVIEEQKIYNKMQFICSFPFFVSWSYREVKTISYHFEPMAVSINQAIIKQNEVTNHFYVVCEGEYEVRYTIPSPKGAPRKNMGQQISYSICILGPGEFFGEEAFLMEPQNEFVIKPQAIEGQNVHQQWGKSLCSIITRSVTGIVYRITREDIQRRFWDSKTQVVFLDIISAMHSHRAKKVIWAQQEHQHQALMQKQVDDIAPFVSPLKKLEVSKYNLLRKRKSIGNKIDKDYVFYKQQEKKAIEQFKKLFIDRNCSHAQVRTYFDQKTMKNQGYFDRNTYNKLFFRFQNKLSIKNDMPHQPTKQTNLTTKHHRYHTTVPKHHNNYSNITDHEQMSPTTKESNTQTSNCLRICKQKLFFTEDALTTRANTSNKCMIRINTSFSTRSPVVKSQQDKFRLFKKE